MLKQLVLITAGLLTINLYSINALADQCPSPSKPNIKFIGVLFDKGNPNTDPAVGCCYSNNVQDTIYNGELPGVGNWQASSGNVLPPALVNCYNTLLPGLINISSYCQSQSPSGCAFQPILKSQNKWK